MILLAICCLHSVHCDASKRYSPAHQQGLLSYWLDGRVHERTIFDKLKSLVWEVQRLSYTRITGLIVDALIIEEVEEGEKEEQ